jgi:hypothetical protein
LKHRDVKVLWAMWPRLAIRDGLLKRRFEDAVSGADRWQIVVPGVYRQEFMSVAHRGMMGGHLGRQKTTAAIQSRAYWPTWSTDLDTFMRRCSTCARYCRETSHRTPLQTPLVGEPWQRVHVHVTGHNHRCSLLGTTLNYIRLPVLGTTLNYILWCLMGMRLNCNHIPFVFRIARGC